MRVALVTPYYHQPRGNTVTVERISLGLARLGITTEIISITEENRFPELPAVDLVHGFNAHEFRKYWNYRGSSAIPYLVTLTGTDLNYALFSENARYQLIKTLEGSAAVHVFTEEAKNTLCQEVPTLKNKLYIIPQGIAKLPPRPSEFKKEEGNFVFLLPAGIRKVKNIPAAIALLAPLYAQNPKIRLWLVGPIIEDSEWGIVQKLVQENQHWVQYLGEIPHLEMGSIYQYADVVLNTSFKEGQSAAVLEAMALGIPVLVSHTTGNWDIVQQGKTGFLYAGKSDFIFYVQALMADEGLRNQLGLNGQAYVQTHHSAKKEAHALHAIYTQIFRELSVETW